jgi:hypothetical protein
LAALFYVLEKDEDLSAINRNHPKIRKNKFYQPEAYFPDDISILLPPDGDHWWEALGMSLFNFFFLFSQFCKAAEARAWEQHAPSPPPRNAPSPPPHNTPPPPQPKKRSVRLLLGPPPVAPAPAPAPAPVPTPTPTPAPAPALAAFPPPPSELQDVEMEEVDELADDDYTPVSNTLLDFLHFLTVSPSPLALRRGPREEGRLPSGLKGQGSGSGLPFPSKRPQSVKLAHHSSSNVGIGRSQTRRLTR